MDEAASASARLAAATLLAASVAVDGDLRVTIVALVAPNSADYRAATLFMSISSRVSPKLGSTPAYSKGITSISAKFSKRAALAAVAR